LNANSDNEVYAKFDDEGVSDRAKSLAEVINLISDDKSLLIYKTIFLASGDSSEILRTQLKLTRKQYYSRISRLTKAGLVKRQKGRYFVTSFGKVIYEAQRLLESAVKNLWSLKAIDSLGVAIDDNMPKEERVKIINLMISNPQIKEILLSAKF
jgi:DNA-binding HxlR family transcriptional regulator